MYLTLLWNQPKLAKTEIFGRECDLDVNVSEFVLNLIYFLLILSSVFLELSARH